MLNTFMENTKMIHAFIILIHSIVAIITIIAIIPISFIFSLYSLHSQFSSQSPHSHSPLLLFLALISIFFVSNPCSLSF